jgi:hypothetical protein
MILVMFAQYRETAIFVRTCNTSFPAFMDKITTRINEKYLDEQGILHITVIEGAHIDLEALKDDHAASFTLTGHKKVLALYDGRAFFTITPEARNYVKSGILDQTRIATAAITNRLAVRILLNGFMKINKPKTPFRMFGTKEDAMKWLMTFKKN